MQNREFENKVQDKMEELKLTPSEAVWDKVEASLPKEKKRRWVIFLLLFAALMLGSFLLWDMFKTNDKNDNIKATAIAEKKASVQQRDTIKENKSFKNNEDSTVIDLPTKTITGTNHNNDAEFISNKKNVHSRSSLEAKIKNGNIGLVNDVTANDDAIGKGHKKTTTNAALKIKVRSPQQFSEETTFTKPVDSIGITANDTGTEPVVAMNDSVKTGNKISPVDLLTVIKKDTASTVAQKKGKQQSVSKWHYGVELAAGNSNVKNDLFSTTPVYPTSFSGTISSPGGNPPSSVPAEPTNNIGFNAGFYIEKNINQQWAFRTGLNYLYQSNTIKVGNKIDSAINFGIDTNKNFIAASYYRPGTSTGYKNKFHFLEIPLILQYQFPNSSRFYIEAGPSITYLVQSNALIYSTRSQTYVTDREVFNKFGIAINGGVAVSLARRSALPFSIGYRFKYSISSVVKPTFGKQHFINSLLYLRIPLKK